MSLHYEFADDEPVDDPDEIDDPWFSPSLPYPVANLKRLQESITAQMTAAFDAKLVTGWASSVSRADGSQVYRGEGGFARMPHQVLEYAPAQTGKGLQAGHGAVIGSETKPGVLMSPYQPQLIGSCSKVITGTSALAAQWAISTNFGAHHPRDLVHLNKTIHRDELQEQAQQVKIANHLPKHWDLSRVDGTGAFWSKNPSGVKGTPQTTKIILKHMLQMRSYIQRQVTSSYSPPDGLAAAGYYQNVKAAIQQGPVLTPSKEKTDSKGNALIQSIGSGDGVYSNSGYDALRLVIAYTLARSPQSMSGSPYFLTLPTVDALEAMSWQERDFFTALIHQKFVEEHVFKSCGVEGYLRPIGDIAYYNIGAPSPEVDFEYIPTNSTLHTVGGGGWNMSADGLRKFLVGLQQGKPFGGHDSWWHKVIWRHWYGSDCPWLGKGSGAFSHLNITGGQRRIYHKNGGDGFPFLDSSIPPAKAGARSQLMIARDATVTLLVNSSGGGSVGKLSAVVKKAYRAALA